MKTFAIYGKVVGTKYIGTIKAKNKKEAEEKASEKSYVSLCHYCSKGIKTMKTLKLKFWIGDRVKVKIRNITIIGIVKMISISSNKIPTYMVYYQINKTHKTVPYYEEELTKEKK